MRPLDQEQDSSVIVRYLYHKLDCFVIVKHNVDSPAVMAPKSSTRQCCNYETPRSRTR